MQLQTFRRTIAVFIIVLLMTCLGLGCSSNSDSALNLEGQWDQPSGRQDPSPAMVYDLLDPVSGTTIHGAGSQIDLAVSDKSPSFIEGTELIGIPGYDDVDGDGEDEVMNLTYSRVLHVAVGADTTSPEYHGRFYPRYADYDSDTEAWKIYKWHLPAVEGTQTITFDMSGLLSSISGKQVGLARDLNGNYIWEWFSIPNDGKVTLASIDPYIDSGYLLMFVMFTRTSQWAGAAYNPLTLESISIGSDDTLVRLNGAGGDEFISSQVANLNLPIHYLSLPVSCDLSNMLPTPRDQKNSDTCVLQAIGDGALNLEYQEIYSFFGWNCMDTEYRVSPRYLHIRTGDLIYVDPYLTGRYADRVLNYIISFGVATEDMVPWLDPTIYSKPEWCRYSLTLAQAEDALKLDIEDWWYLNISEETRLSNPTYWEAVKRENIKATLAHQHRGIVFSSSNHCMIIVGYDDNENGGSWKIRETGTQPGPGYYWQTYGSFDHIELAVVHEEYNPKAELAFLGTQTTTPPPVRVQVSKGTVADKVELNWICDGSPTWGYKVHRDNVGNVVGYTTNDYWTDENLEADYAHAYWIEAVYDLLENPDCALGRPVLGWGQ